MPKLYLVRHAEPTLTGVLLGQCDPPAKPCKLELPEGKVYTSALRRARETAEGIVIPELNEISYGEWDGLTWTEIEQRWPDLSRQKLKNWTAITPPGGELWQAFKSRVQAAYQRITNSLPSRDREGALS